MTIAQAEAPRLKTYQYIWQLIRFRPWLCLLDLLCALAYRFADQIAPGRVRPTGSRDLGGSGPSDQRRLPLFVLAHSLTASSLCSVVADWAGSGRPLSLDHPAWSKRNA